MGRLAGSAEQKKQRKDEEQKARRERRLREMMAESEAEWEDNPFVHVIGNRQQANLNTNTASHHHPKERPIEVQNASATGPVPPRSNVDLTLRQRPQLEPRLQQQYTRPTVESADEPPNPPTQRAERVKAVVPRTTSATVRNLRTGTSEAYLRRVLERVQSWEDARDQARGGREPTQAIPSSSSGTRNSAIISDNTPNEAHLTPKETNRQDGLTSDTRTSRTIAHAPSCSKLLVQLPQKTYGPRETTVESSIKQIGRSEPERAVSISSTSSKTANSDVELFTPLSPPPELPVSRTSTWSPAEEERSIQKRFYFRDTGHSAGRPSSNLSYGNNTPLAETGDRGTPFGSSRGSSCSRDELPHLGHRAGFSPLQVQHDDRVRESSIPKIAELNLSDEFGSRPATSEEKGQDTTPLASVQNENNSDYEPSSSNPTPTASARSMSAFGPDSRPITPITGHQDMDDSPSGLTASHLSLMSSPGLSRTSSMHDLAEHATPSASRPPPPSVRRRTVLDNYLRAIYEQETRGGPDFLTRQGKMYQEVFRQFFDLNCYCKAPAARAKPGTNTNGDLNINTQVNEEVEPEHTHSLRERVEYLQRSLPPLSVLFGEGSYDPTPYFTHWQKFLAEQPIETLSFQKTQNSFMRCARKVWRWWDIDSIRLGGNTLAAIRAPNDFRITFLPRYGLNMSTDQVVQPHGLTLAKTRHVLMGYFQAGRVRFSVFVFFPSSASTTYSKTSASSNTLSHERLKELYDEILLPALRESIRGPFCQEVPQSFDMIYAKSRSFQEKPGMGQWSADDESRPFQLAYTLPATRLSQFWSSFEDKANLFKLRTKRGKLVAYFRNPRLVFQAHDLKNSLTGASVDDVLSQLDKTVLSAFNPDHLDMRSCWVDIGVRYCAEGPSGEQRVFSQPATFLWKSRCNRHSHENLAKLSPESPLSATHYRSFLLRDAGNMVSKTTTTKTHNAGHPDCRQLGTILAKTYSCNKELFGVMFSHYGLYNSPHLALMALTQDMIQDLDSMTKDRERVFTTRRCRESISRAWEANRRHVEAISDSRSGVDYGARKEVTFCLGTILKEWSEGHFDPNQNPHTGPGTHIVPATGADSDAHCPFWIVPTRDMNDFIFTQAARLVLPLDHLFLEATLISNDETSLCNTGEQFIRRLFAFYTAQLICRLLIHTFSSERELSYDNWIWYPSWRVKKTDGVMVERRGLGLDEQIDAAGMLWLPHEVIDWRRGHISLEKLIELYIPRSPLQARLTSQTNIQGLATTQLTVEYVLQEWVQEAKRAFKERRNKKGNELAERIIRLSAEEIARAYNRHLLTKMQAYWDRVRSSIGRDLLPALTRLQKAQEDVMAERSRIVTAQTIWEIYQEAWTVYAKVVPDEDDGTHMPMELPCWMTTRKYQPPKHNWTDLVHHEVFFRPVKPKWNKIHFLQVLRTFRRIWFPIKAYAGRFEQHVKPILGRSVMVAFNCNQAKEVGTSRTPRTWYHGKPSFFQMQYWAPYFSPPEDNGDLRVECMHSEAPRILTAIRFQDLERVVHQHWLCIMDRTQDLRSTSKELVNDHCRRALRRMTLLAGPNWGNEDQLDHIVPWQLGTADAFRVPLPPAVVAKAGSDSLLSAPTILLPTRDAVVSLFRKIRSCPGLTEGVKKRLKWARRRLDNEGHQYDIPSHLEAKAEAGELTTQSPSLLRQFLAQTEPPERQILGEDMDEAETGSEQFVGEDSQSEPESEPESEVESGIDNLDLWDELAGTC